MTFPEYPASSNLAIMLSTSRTCSPAPGLEAVMLFLLIVAVKALPGVRDELDALAWIVDGPGEGDRPLGEEAIAEGGGDVPRRDERRPPAGLAMMVVLVGPAGDGGAKLAPALGMGDPAPRVAALPEDLSLSRDPSGRTVCLDPAELKLDTDPLGSLPLELFRPREGVFRLPLPPLTSMGDGGEDPSLPEKVLESICVALRLSARSLAESSFDRVRPIFLDGV